MVRIGHTTIDSVTRAMQSLCNNNVLGIVVNGARRGELYSKYTYYHSYYTPKEEDGTDVAAAVEDSEHAELASAAGGEYAPASPQSAETPTVEKKGRGLWGFRKRAAEDIAETGEEEEL